MRAPVIHPAAYRHGVAEVDIRAAHSTPIAIYADQGDLDLTMHVGFSADVTQLLEVGFASTGDPQDPVVIVHAMPARAKYLPHGPRPTRRPER